MFDLFKDLNSLRPLLARQDKWKFVVLLCLMFIASVLEAVAIGAIPAFVALVMSPSSLSDNQWVGDWLPNLPDTINMGILLWASSALFFFIVFKNLFLAFVFYIQARIVTSQQLKLGDRMFRVYQSAPYEWHLQRSSSELLRNIQTDTAQILRGVLLPFLDLIMAIIMTIVVMAVMVVSMPGPALLSLLVTGAGLFVVMRLFQKRLQRIGQVIWREHEGIIKSIQQGFGALVDARILGCEDYLSKVHRDSLKRQTVAQRQQLTIQKSTQYAIETIAVFALLVIFILLVQTAENLEDVLPVIILLGVATVRLKQFATKIAGATNQIHAARAYIPTIVNDLNELDRIEAGRHESMSIGSNESGFNRLSIEGVTYTYPGVGTPALQNVSLQLHRGESIAFVGPTGCGKTTLANVILGLLEPESGVVALNGTDIKKDIDGWRSHLGYIPQSIYLIDDTIRVNVAFGVAQYEIDEDRLSEALGSAHLDEFINSLPEGLETIVGERGVRLSGGQRQRLGIARALYPNPDVLVMDEATSSLDNKTEVQVMEAIQDLRQNRTLIMIAHRLSTVEDCDRLYFLRDGQIEATGTYKELIRHSARFQEMAGAEVS